MAPTVTRRKAAATAAATRTTRAARPKLSAAHVTQIVESIDERMSARIQMELLKSLAKNPKQTAAFRSSETNRIATRFGVRTMAVAGVRSNLTRGAYGSYKKLLAEASAKLSK